MNAGKPTNKSVKAGLKKAPPKRSASEGDTRRISTADFRADLTRQGIAQREKDIAAWYTTCWEELPSVK